MRHLALPFYCAFIVGLMLALLARAIYTGAHSFVLVALVGIGYFGPACVIETRRCWPAFRAEIHRRSAERQRAPLPADDTH
ncbi:TPA: hypothetical protein ACOEPF_000644 [Stenotrophomonas maltophilia]|jgi:hypothetical protein|uniref:hypothetical protein n=1 Tax=Stenotrophomonas TaxID=40323 RepID=UPI002446A033|nr:MULTISPECIES: hypothetical protein [Stenotrophomonas]MBN5024692.1 hypothetical protein [Stenotrophomonas maltophilia]MDH1483628.1 hypothetical protein [Stenotrophomonas sp. GD03712]WON69568.1 hypothetical protein RWT08_04275 [Stenotrophomonas maltophilia]HDS1101049.1 hypothetical protein [Stenotrophomonas maltophilia]HDS1107123.1 hypothetical protein [Stenotrophomonas maltophilia]